METKISIDKNNFSSSNYLDFALVSDIGGTKTPLSMFGKKKDGTIEHIFTLLWRSSEITDFTSNINEALKFAYDEYKITADNIKGAFGVAGPIENKRTFSKPTNLSWHVDAEHIKNNSFLKKIILLNDFEIVGYGIDMLKREDIVQLNNAVAEEKSTAAVLGAGTGLGMAILPYNKEKKLHVPTASEGGHSTMPVMSKEDVAIAKSIMKLKGYKHAAGYEPYVSGPGIANLYDYFASKKMLKSKIHKKINFAADKSAEIAKNCRTDKICRQAMDKFLQYYGRAAGNLALTTYAKGGIYVAGGIAPKIINELENGFFIEEFERNYRKDDILKKIPVFVVMNPDVGLLGAANAAFNFFDDLIN